MASDGHINSPQLWCAPVAADDWREDPPFEGQAFELPLSRGLTPPPAGGGLARPSRRRTPQERSRRRVWRPLPSSWAPPRAIFFCMKRIRRRCRPQGGPSQGRRFELAWLCGRTPLPLSPRRRQRARRSARLRVGRSTSENCHKRGIRRRCRFLKPGEGRRLWLPPPSPTPGRAVLRPLNDQWPRKLRAWAGVAICPRKRCRR